MAFSLSEIFQPSVLTYTPKFAKKNIINTFLGLYDSHVRDTNIRCRQRSYFGHVQQLHTSFISNRSLNTLKTNRNLLVLIGYCILITTRTLSLQKWSWGRPKSEIQMSPPSADSQVNAYVDTEIFSRGSRRPLYNAIHCEKCGNQSFFGNSAMSLDPLAGNHLKWFFLGDESIVCCVTYINTKSRQINFLPRKINRMELPWVSF